jgi:pimeloyl-ACP methyl ester carboxylesterase
VRVGHRRAYQERIPGVVVRDIPATHFVHTDQPAAVAEAIAEFVSG